MVSLVQRWEFELLASVDKRALCCGSSMSVPTVWALALVWVHLHPVRLVPGVPHPLHKPVLPAQFSQAVLVGAEVLQAFLLFGVCVLDNNIIPTTRGPAKPAV